MSFAVKLEKLSARYTELREQLAEAASLDSDAYAKLSKEFSDLEPVAMATAALHKAQAELKEAEELLATETDPDLKAMAEAEMVSLKEQIPELDQSIRLLLLPKDADDERNVIMEFRPAAGGDEAALFAGVLYRMYQRYAERQRWKFEPLSVTDTGIGGVKEASAQITGKGVFARLKFESGVHRVQRVPVTETSGRIHTSTATVSVLPEVADVEIDIQEKDLRIDVFRSSGPGGQSVNTTDSAVRITHLPTGLVVQQQDEKSQHKNKAKALKVLKARLYERERAATMAELAANRKGQIGTGDRSERIRTYNFPQGRVSDHRINVTLYNLDRFVDGEIDAMLDALIAEDQASRLSEVEE
jgi:peptide chain release factor 1